MEPDLDSIALMLIVHLLREVESTRSDCESDSYLESTLTTLISKLFYLRDTTDPEWEPKITSLIIQIITLIKSRDLDAQPKPESKLMSLVSQAISVFNSMDLDSLPKPLSKLITYIYEKVSIDSNQKPESELELKSLVDETLELKPDHEIISLFRQIAISKKCRTLELILLVPQVQVSFHEGKFRVEPLKKSDTWKCFVGDLKLFSLTQENYSTHFCCRSCNGENHQEYEKAPVKIKHPLHRKHSLQLAFNKSFKEGSSGETRECYCCNEDLPRVFYFCSACDFALNIACVEKPMALSIPHSKLHEHELFLFPRKTSLTSLTCDICALATSNSPFCICHPCVFVAHLKCINLPRVIKISRHPHHRLCHTPSFEEGDWSCGVCRRNIDNDFGGYSCIRDGCSYAAHSRCATQRNVWDGIDLDGEPEEIEEEVAEPFLRISDGIIQHFSHDHHHLRLDENTCRDYDENKLCEACVTPIYFGNFYSCLQCQFVLHETCAHLSRKLYHPVHPHVLTLAIVRDAIRLEDPCAACDRRLPTAGFFYECGKEDCDFRLHVQCAVISEPLVHRSHVHPLFLTSKPGEKRKCSVCPREIQWIETFNCIDERDDFALCFCCATLPQKLRYKHDKHILTLSYGEETGTVTDWCEACEGKINPKKGFYICDEYCCVTLHIKCLIGRDLYMKPGSSFFYRHYPNPVGVQSNSHHMSRPTCFLCKKRCPDKIVFQCCGLIFCSPFCWSNFLLYRSKHR